jgi:hypothetical protein
MKQEISRDNRGLWLPGASANPGGRPAVIREVQDLARQHTPAAINTLVEICGNKKAHPSARVAAATAILDRGWGRPMQQVHVEASQSALPAELAALSPEQKRAAGEMILRRLAEENAKTIDATSVSLTEEPASEIIDNQADRKS